MGGELDLTAGGNRYRGAGPLESDLLVHRLGPRVVLVHIEPHALDVRLRQRPRPLQRGPEEGLGKPAATRLGSHEYPDDLRLRDLRRVPEVIRYAGQLD